MKSFLSALILCACAAMAHAADPVPPPAAVSTNTLVIISEGGARFSKTNAFWRRHVRAADTNMYIECELLTALFSTNTVRTNLTRIPNDEPPRLEEADSDSRLDFIIAETNVMIITPKAQIIGDRAVYNASNDVMIVTGELVIAVDKNGSIVCTQVIFDLKTDSFEVDGPNMFYGRFGIASRTNAPSTPRNPSTPAPRKPN